MNAPDFDRQMRQHHAASLQALSPQTLARLHSARHGAARPRRGLTFAWLGATACTAVLAVVAATQLMPPAPRAVPATSTPVMAVQSPTTSDQPDAFVSTADVLDQNPDLYVWLGSDTTME